MMQTLDRKLLRDLTRLWSQSLAIASVLAVGVAIMVMMAGAERSLRETRDTFYERNQFGEVFASVTRAPIGLLDRIEAIPGVAVVETRIRNPVILDIENMLAPGTGMLLSLPHSFAQGTFPRLNRPSLDIGRWPEAGRDHEVVVNDSFAKAHEFALGDGFYAIINGQRRHLTIVGTALSPEFIYTIGPGSIMPDDKRFGVIWMDGTALTAAFNQTGAFNDLSLRVEPGTNLNEVLRQLDLILAPYGGTGAYLRKDQISHSFLDAELTQLATMVKIVPPIFLVVSAFLVNMVLGRLVSLEREQIGLLKALGYRQSEIAWHYIKLALCIGAFGVALGWGFGLWGGRGIAELYAKFFHFPYLVFVPYPSVYAVSALAGVAAAGLGAVFAVHKIVALSPAVAMSPPAPHRFRAGVADRLIHAVHMRQTSMMIWRSLTRWPLRAGLTMLGIATSAAVMVAALFMFDSMDALMDKAFVQLNRQDMILNFVQDRPRSVIDDVDHLPGVMVSEGVWSMPVRLSHDQHERRTVLEARDAGSELTHLLNENDQPVEPDSGIVLTQRLAKQLGLKLGQSVSIRFPSIGDREHKLAVVGYAAQSFGMGAYVTPETMTRLTGRAARVTQSNVMVDPDEIDALFAVAKTTPALSGVVEMRAVRQSFTDTIAQNAGMMTTINALMAALIAVGVVYNAARIQLSERARELASLRILGFTNAEVSYILLGELAFLTLLAIPLGLVLGYLLAAGMVAGFESDLYAIPLEVSRVTYFRAAWVVALASALSAAVVWRRIDQMDLVSVMKTRE
ncbi:FtsX-like permease family protein [Aliiroseovarius sp. KMU-50]|uniref:FtsX-like permease family protein n=1 Tax=Aliiroseovarius salicola TaxID=3009082 RepID=A0ABT4W0Y7_9RHOB|nr:ABC transporter permease [Aliiroseovarius sp. KMU-50]MDA5094166.1 FtsX-like permease family protein [Aliiroseovarius sp. KMU-50]